LCFVLCNSPVIVLFSPRLLWFQPPFRDIRTFQVNSSAETVFLSTVRPLLRNAAMNFTYDLTSWPGSSTKNLISSSFLQSDLNYSNYPWLVLNIVCDHCVLLL
jgi:hypothetical protein